jgi:putative flippase GtrA
MKKNWKSDALLILRFLAVGGLNTGFGYMSYAVLVLIGLPLWGAVAGMTILGFIFNFFSYGGIVFGSTSHTILPRYLVFYCLLGALNYALLFGLTRNGVDRLVAQAILVPLLAVVGFVGMRQFVFRGEKRAVAA